MIHGKMRAAKAAHCAWCIIGLFGSWYCDDVDVGSGGWQYVGQADIDCTRANGGDIPFYSSVENCHSQKARIVGTARHSNQRRDASAERD